MPVVFSAPHRALFFAGVSSALLLMGWWLFSLMGTGSTGGMGWLIHGYWMLLGVLPFFMAGFIFTAGPKWLAVAAPPRSAWLSMGGLMVSGVLLSMVGAGQVPLLWPLGVTLLALGTGVLMVVWSGRIAASKQADRRHAWAVLLAFALGTLAHGAAVMWVWTGEVDWWWRMRELALWGFLLPVFLTISHRMLPFFSGAALPIYSVWRPDWLLAAFWAGSLGHGGLALLGVPTVWVDLPFAALLGFVSVRWGLRASQKVKLLAMLHLAFAWAAVAFALYSLNAGLLALGMPLDAANRAPLHALSIGFFTTMALGFVTRVSLGHSGRPLAVTPRIWQLYLGLHGVALCRVLGAYLPLSWQAWLMPLLAVAWVGIFAAWAMQFVPIYFKPRADGQAG